MEPELFICLFANAIVAKREVKESAMAPAIAPGTHGWGDSIASAFATADVYRVQ